MNLFDVFTSYINESIRSGTFPDRLKDTNIVPNYKSKNAFDKPNYRPVSILSLLSKVYERLIFQQLSNYAKRILR